MAHYQQAPITQGTYQKLDWKRMSLKEKMKDHDAKLFCFNSSAEELLLKKTRI